MNTQQAVVGIAIAVLMACGKMFAQTPASESKPAKTEIGFVGGAGVFTAEDDTPSLFGVFGAEACTLCSGRFGLFLEYTHWQRAQNIGHIQRGDLGAIGLRIQSRGRRLRPFFDAGFAGGADHYSYWSYAPGYPVGIAYGSDAHSLYGLVLGGGVSILTGKHWYIRPQVRLYALRAFHVAADASVGVGFRF